MYNKMETVKQKNFKTPPLCRAAAVRPFVEITHPPLCFDNIHDDTDSLRAAKGKLNLQKEDANSSIAHKDLMIFMWFHLSDYNCGGNLGEECDLTVSQLIHCYFKSGELQSDGENTVKYGWCVHTKCVFLTLITWYICLFFSEPPNTFKVASSIFLSLCEIRASTPLLFSECIPVIFLFHMYGVFTLRCMWHECKISSAITVKYSRHQCVLILFTLL